MGPLPEFSHVTFTRCFYFVLYLCVDPLNGSLTFSSCSQVDNAKILHYVGAGIAFPTSMLFVCLQSALTYRLAKTQGEYNLAHLRLCMTLLAFVALVLSILSSLYRWLP